MAPRLEYIALDALDEAGIPTDRLYTIRILLEGALRSCDGFLVTEEDVRRILKMDAGWYEGGDPVPAQPCHPAGLHRRPCGRGPRRPARRHGGSWWRPRACQPTSAR